MLLGRGVNIPKKRSSSPAPPGGRRRKHHHIFISFKTAGKEKIFVCIIIRSDHYTPWVDAVRFYGFNCALAFFAF